MKFLLLLIPLLAGCSTTIYDHRTGKAKLRVFGDAVNIRYKDRYCEFSADKLTHSVPTRAAGTAASGVIATTSAALVTKGLVQ